jgi:hypothetical protein
LGHEDAEIALEGMRATEPTTHERVAVRKEHGHGEIVTGTISVTRTEIVPGWPFAPTAIR